MGIIEQTDLPANLTEGASLIIPESLENDASSSAGLAVDQPIGEEGTVWEVPDWEASLSSGSNVKVGWGLFSLRAYFLIPFLS